MSTAPPPAAPCALSVNVNKVALLRNSRYLGIPSVLRAAQACLQAGAHGITVHPRPDQRHIRSADVFELAELLQDWPGREYNVEGNPGHNLLEVARALKARGLPLHQLTFVPDSEGQFTSDHGWNVAEQASALRGWIAQAQALGARVSLFMDAEAAPMAAVCALGADRVELYTEPYAQAHAQAQVPISAAADARAHAVSDAAAANPAQAALQAQVQRFAAAAEAARAAGLGVNAGHDLNQANLSDFLCCVPAVREVSIGHALMADALELGYSATVQAYLRCIERAAAGASSA